MSSSIEPKLYAAGFVSDPISYAINTLQGIHILIGQDKTVTFAIMALEELREELAEREKLAEERRSLLSAKHPDLF